MLCRTFGQLLRFSFHLKMPSLIRMHQSPCGLRFESRELELPIFCFYQDQTEKKNPKSNSRQYLQLSINKWLNLCEKCDKNKETHFSGYLHFFTESMNLVVDESSPPVSYRSHMNITFWSFLRRSLQN